MPEASVAVTQAAVESFAESYLRTLGASIDKAGDVWDVSLPTDHPLSVEGTSITIGAGPRLEDDAADVLLTPESGFFDELLEMALTAAPLGRAVFTTETVSDPETSWLDTDAGRYDTTFYPLYDREAVCLWFRASVETVSEYETEYLYAIGVDSQTGEVMPTLGTGLVTNLESVVSDAEDDADAPTPTEFQPAISTAREAVEAELRPELKTLQDKASTAAAEELDRYQQLRKQELQEIDERLSNIESQLEDISDTIEAAADRQARVEALTRREELTDEQSELEANREEIRGEIEKGFPAKRSEIRDRHAVRVSIEPVALTDVTYERGDLEIRDTTTDTAVVTLPAAPGIGLLEPAECETCGTELSESNSARPRDGALVGACCRRSE